MGKTLNAKRALGIFLFVVAAVFAAHGVANPAWAAALAAGTALEVFG